MIIIPKGAIIALVIIMKRKILVGLLTAVIFLACALVINITPKVEKGSVVLTCDGSKYELPGTEKTRYCNGKSESLSAEESFEDLLYSVPSFNVKADVDKDGNVTLKTPMSVEVTGDRLGDVLYTVYSYDGKVLAKESKKLELPKEDIDGCLVKIKITWGKKDTLVCRNVQYRKITKNVGRIETPDVLFLTNLKSYYAHHTNNAADKSQLCDRLFSYERYNKQRTQYHRLDK